MSKIHKNIAFPRIQLKNTRGAICVPQITVKRPAKAIKKTFFPIKISFLFPVDEN